jgi:hypothetical protein
MIKSFIKRGKYFALLLLLFTSVFTSYFNADNAYAAVTHYGRVAYGGYFTNMGWSHTYANSCGTNLNRLMCDGLVGVTDYTSLVNFYSGKLNGTDTQANNAAAFTVLSMLGVDGPNAGNPATVGVANARGRFSEWATIVKNYNDAGKIHYSQTASYTINTAYNSKGDVFWYNDSDSAESVVFDTSNGAVAIKKACGNLVGTLAALPYVAPSVDWSISATSSVDKSTVAPGDTVNWTHTIKNDGPTKTNNDVTYHYQDRQDLGGASGPDKIFSSGQVNGATATFQSTYTVADSDLGKTLCRSTSNIPASSTVSGWNESASACVSVPYNWTISTPIVTLDHSGAVDAGSSMTATAKINNSGPTSSKPSKWELTRIVVQPSKDVPNVAGGLSATDPCGTYFKSSFSNCATAGSGAGLTFKVGDNPLGDFPTEIEDLAIGTKICYALSVQPASSSNNSWNHSAPVCVTISKKPKIQILGGDLWVGVPFSGSASVAKVSAGTVTKKGFTFGSWIEYGIFATDVIKGAGSGAAFAGQGQQNSTVCSSSVLSFTNAGDSQCSDTMPIGSYATTKIMPDVEASFPSTAAIGNLKSDDLVSGALKSGIYTASGVLTLSGGNIIKGQWVVLSAPDADITIDGDIKYTNEVLNSASDIPQLVIIAKNIYITDKVKQVDAWLIAKGAASSSDGTINTCSSVAVNDPLTINLCNQQLVVNGPVMANKLYLRRTFGSDPCIGSDCSPSSIPSEIFNLRPDAFLWATGRSVVSGRLQTVYTTELPPRL